MAHAYIRYSTPRASLFDTCMRRMSVCRFDVLAQRRPNLRQELLTFRDTLASSSDDEGSVKVWQLKDVGLQAAQRVASASEPLALLTDISQSFPSLVSSLSKQKVEASLRYVNASLRARCSRPPSCTHSMQPANMLAGKCIERCKGSGRQVQVLTWQCVLFCTAHRSAVTSNQQFLHAGANFMLINGLAFEISNSFDYFSK